MSTPFFPADVNAVAAACVKICTEKKLMITTVESCTGGLIAACITDVPGSSVMMDRGFITYSYQAKTDLVGVGPNTLALQGAVSEEVAREMAMGAFSSTNMDIAVAVTGIAGPGGATETKPVGLVYVAVASKNGIRVIKNLFDGDRSAVRLQTVKKALQEVIAEAESL